MNPTGYEDQVVAEYYDHAEPLKQRNDIAFFVDYAKNANGNVLELGCGTGRILVPTAEAGVKITGIDSSKAMLDVCRNKMNSLPHTIQNNITLIESDIRSFQVNQKYSLITVPFRAFHHLISVKDQLSCLQCVKEHLAHDGLFILDLFNPVLQRLLDEKGVSSKMEEPEVTLENGKKIKRIQKNHSSNPNTQVVHVNHTYLVTESDRSQSQISVDYPMRYFFRYEMGHLLARSGFEIIDEFCDYQHTTFDELKLSEMIYLSRLST